MNTIDATSALVLDKKRMRKRLTEALKRMDPSMKDDESIVKTVLALPQWKQAGQLFAFVPLASEPDITPLLDIGIALGKQVSVPVCGTGREMRFVPISVDWREHMESGALGVRHPVGEISMVTATPDKTLHPLMLVPGLGFTAAGARIGRGGGYYDRFLGDWGSTLITVGICYRIQLVEDIPQEPFDLNVDFVITD